MRGYTLILPSPIKGEEDIFVLRGDLVKVVGDSGEGQNPDLAHSRWMPAFAGMTRSVFSRESEIGLNKAIDEQATLSGLVVAHSYR